MKIKVDRKKFAAAIGAVGQITGRTMPILGCVFFELQDDGALSLECTNLDISLRTTIPVVEVQTGKDKAIAVPVSRLKPIASAIDSETLSVSLEAGSKLSLIGGTSRFSILTMDPAEFPRAHNAEGTSIKLPQAELLRLIDATRKSASEDETRYILNGVFLTGSGKKIEAVSTDGRRMHHATATHEADIGKWSFILPSNAVNVIRGFLASEGTVELTISDRRVYFQIDTESGPVFVASKVVEGNFPNWSQVLPKSDARGIAIPIKQEALLSSVRRVAMCCSEKSNTVKFTVSGQVLRINASSPDFGSSEEEIALTEKPGDRVIAINPSFVLDALDASQSDDCKFFIRDEVSPAMIVAENYESVLMPVRLN